MAIDPNDKLSGASVPPPVSSTGVVAPPSEQKIVIPDVNTLTIPKGMFGPGSTAPSESSDKPAIRGYSDEMLSFGGDALGGFSKPVGPNTWMDMLKHIRLREGYRNDIYPDPIYPNDPEKRTVGVGHLIKPGDPEYGKPVGTIISDERIMELLERDARGSYEKAVSQANQLGVNSSELVVALASANFQLGDFSAEFKGSWPKMVNGDYVGALKGVEDSKWNKQTPIRVDDLQIAICKLAALKGHPVPDHIQVAIMGKVVVPSNTVVADAGPGISGVINDAGPQPLRPAQPAPAAPPSRPDTAAAQPMGPVQAIMDLRDLMGNDLSTFNFGGDLSTPEGQRHDALAMVSEIKNMLKHPDAAAKYNVPPERIQNILRMDDEQMAAVFLAAARAQNGNNLGNGFNLQGQNSILLLMKADGIKQDWEGLPPPNSAVAAAPPSQQEPPAAQPPAPGPVDVATHPDDDVWVEPVLTVQAPDIPAVPVPPVQISDLPPPAIDGTGPDIWHGPLPVDVADLPPQVSGPVGVTTLPGQGIAGSPVPVWAGGEPVQIGTGPGQTLPGGLTVADLNKLQDMLDALKPHVNDPGYNPAEPIQNVPGIDIADINRLQIVLASIAAVHDPGYTQKPGIVPFDDAQVTAVDGDVRVKSVADVIYGNIGSDIQAPDVQGEFRIAAYNPADGVRPDLENKIDSGLSFSSSMA